VESWPDTLKFLDLRHNPFEGVVPAYIVEYLGPNIV